MYPPLWGAKSFNDGAGKNRLVTMSALVRYNMPMAVHRTRSRNKKRTTSRLSS